MLINLGHAVDFAELSDIDIKAWINLVHLSYHFDGEGYSPLQLQSAPPHLYEGTETAESKNPKN